MNIQQLCDYLNEIGIIDMDSVKHFLQISSYMINNNIQHKSNKSISDIYKIALFSYIREINVDDQNLYFTCSNIINSYKRFIILKKCNSLFLFKKIIYLKIYQRYKNFLLSLYKKFPFKSYRTNKYHENKKKKPKNKTTNNILYIPNDPNLKDELKKYPNVEQNSKFNSIDYNPNIDINKNNIITFKSSEKANSFGFINYKYIKELSPVKKCKQLNNNICINQSNINFEKYFNNKKFVLCKKNHDYLSYIERVKSNKKYLYNKNPYEYSYSYSSFTLRKNKSETKLRIKKMNYEEKTRSKNFETIEPEIKRKIKKRAKSKIEDELLLKEREDRAYNRLIEKEIDKQNWVDRLYRQDLINKKKEERKQKEEDNKKNSKSPIDWEKLYLETNKKIINNNKDQKMNKSCSYFIPKKGRIYKYNNKYTNTIESENNIQNNLNTIEVNNINKEHKTIETSINRDKDKSVKISSDFNSPNKNPNLISNTFEIKESELNSLNSEKEENKVIEKNEETKECNEKINDEIKNSNLSDDNINFEKLKENFNQPSPTQGFKSKGIQELLSQKNDKNKNLKNNEMNINYSDNEQN